jgi:gliding motility-associated-like protein
MFNSVYSQDLSSMTSEERVIYAEKGIQVYFANPQAIQRFSQEFGINTFEFRMKNRDYLGEVSAEIIDMFEVHSFDLDTLESYILAKVREDANELDLTIDPFMEDYSNNLMQNRAAGGPCVNMDFEEGTLNGWEMFEGNVNTNAAEMVGAAQIFTPGVHHTIMGPGADPIAGIPTTNPNGGASSLRLGDGTGTGGKAASVRQTFMVSNANAVFTYSYAVVLEDPSGHALGEKPFFKVNLYDQNGAIIPCGEFQVVASSGLDASWTNYGAGWYKDWSTVFAPLDAYIGQNVTIEFISGDCSQSGHYGYAYVDAECSPLEIIPPGTLICDNQPVTLSAPAGAASYLWNTGATTQSLTTNTPGTYSVDVVPVTGAACSTTLTATVNGSSGTPTTNYTAVPTAVCIGEDIDFTDTSTPSAGGTIDFWEWDFDDGNTSNAEDVVYSFASTGTFDVALVTGEGGCTDTLIQAITVSAGPTADFTVNTVCEGTITQFTDASTIASGTITNWDWDFTDNGTIDNTTQNPTNGYTTAGTYDATLTVSSGACTHSVTLPVVINPTPNAEFSQSDVCDGNVMSFTDASTVSSGTITNWAWDFDDGAGTSAVQNPTYTYGASGSYDVVLTVTSSGGCIDNETVTVNVYDNPTADFDLVDVCDGDDYVFTDNSNGNGATIDTWEWDFTNDGTVDNTDQNTTNLYPTHGSYDVELTVTTQEGCVGSVIQSVDVLELPTAIFTVSQECQGVSTVFTDASTTPTGTITGWAWDFTNDGTDDDITQNPTHLMGNAGGYTAALVVTTSNGCSNSTTNPVTVDPLPTADYNWTDVCEGLVMNFTDGSTVSSGTITGYQWDFGDLTGNAATQNATYTYTTPGTYSAVLTVTTDEGCVGSVTNVVEMFNNPTADFNFADVCNGAPVAFSDNSNGNGATIGDYEWDFTNNGTIEYNGVATDFTYGADGTYDVNLTVTTTDGCTDNLVQSVTVFPTPTASFTGQNVCEGFDVTFTNNSSTTSGVITDYAWDFGMGATSILENPTQTFANEGVYNVLLTVTSDNGCTNQFTAPVEIYPTPVAQFIANDVCDGSVASFTDFSTVSNSSTNNNISSWEWDFGTTPAATAVGQFANHSYPVVGTYTVTLDITSNNGCVNSTTSDVTIYPNPVIDFSSPNPDGCTTWCPDFVNNSSIASGSINSYLWNLGDGTASTDATPIHCYTNNTLVDVSYTVSVTMTSDFGCSTTATEFDLITVYPTPVAAFSNDPLEGTVYDPTINFINQSLISETYDWDFAGLGTSEEEHPTFTFPDQDSGTYNVCLHVESIHGCLNDTCQDVYIQGFSNLYIPNSFTPDGDGVNDFFMPSIYGFSEDEYNFMVFDRWGLLLFKTDNIQGSWDGVYKSMPCQQDGYVWKLQAKDKYTGEKVEKIGHVMLLR